MKKKNRMILNIAYIFEKILAIVVLVAVFFGIIDVIRLIWETYIVNYQNLVQYDQLNAMLGKILLLVIGVELVVMLSLHIPGALIEALLYAIARKMLLIPKSEGMEQILIGVIAIAGLFLIKKYFASPVNNSSGDMKMSIHDEKENNENEEMNDHQVDLFCRISPSVCNVKNRIIKSEKCEKCDFRINGNMENKNDK